MTVSAKNLNLYVDRSAHFVQYSDRYDCVISADESGMIEYWQPADSFELPKNVPSLWSFKSTTDLYEFKKVTSNAPNALPTDPNDFFRQSQYRHASLSPQTRRLS